LHVGNTKRRPDESLSALLRRLDKSVYRAIEFEERTDEVSGQN
jgi:hypothetical protein